MSLFRYRALDSAGRTVVGTLEAADVRTVEQHLRNAGTWLLDAEAGAAAASPQNGSGLRIGRSDLIGFFVQMSLMLRAGVMLPTALDRLAVDYGDSKVGGLLESLRD